MHLIRDILIHHCHYHRCDCRIDHEGLWSVQSRLCENNNIDHHSYIHLLSVYDMVVIYALVSVVGLMVYVFSVRIYLYAQHHLQLHDCDGDITMAMIIMWCSETLFEE